MPDLFSQGEIHKWDLLTTYSYVADWFVYLGVLLFGIWWGSAAEPNYHEFSLADTSLMYSHVPEDDTAFQIPALIGITVAMPAISLVLGNLFYYGLLTYERWLWDSFSGSMAFLGAQAFQLAITAILKNLCGLPRPDMLDRCQPIIPEPAMESYQLANIEICTNSNIPLIRESFRTFPSGHLSTIFASLFFCFLFLGGKLQSFDGRAISIKLLPPLTPLAISLVIACSRVSDNRHFLRDILAGGIIGASTAAWFYFTYFPSILDFSNCGRSFPPRRFGCTFNNVGGFWQIRDTIAGSYTERMDPPIVP